MMSIARLIPSPLPRWAVPAVGLVLAMQPPAWCLTPLPDSGGQLSVVQELETFDGTAASRWKLEHSGNTTCTASFGKLEPGMQNPVLELTCEPKKDSADRGPRWFSLGTPVQTTKVWEEADGLRLVAAVGNRMRWWISVAITSEGKRYSQVALPELFSRDGAMEDRVLPFSRFKTKEGSVFAGGAVTKIELSGSVPKNTLYIDRIELYQTVTLKTWLAFRTNREECNLFERGETVGMTFSLGGEKPEGMATFRYVIRDFHDNIVREGTAVFEGSSTEYATTFEGPPGFYEVRAFLAGPDADEGSSRSCIKSTGSMPQGLGTFAVMPSTMAENLARRKRVGKAAFFGFHGHANGLTDYMGVSWGFGGGRWIWKERKERPERREGTAAWALKEMSDGEPQPEHEVHHIVNLSANHLGATPEWARKPTTDMAPPFADWTDFLNFWRDTIRVNKHLYPHMKPRLYDPAWEINLNVPDTGVHKPPFLPKDVVELYRRTYDVLKEEDPDGILIGPNCSSPINHLGWNEPLFKAGLLDYIGAYNCHGYHSPPPEEGRVVDGFRNLRAMIRKYNDGHDLPIYITELGYRSKYGSNDRYREHARWHTRVAIILKGEGVKAYLPFYGYDYPGKEASWGYCFNLEPTLKWGPRWVAPRPAAPALAVCVKELEGATPVRDLRFFGAGVWGYAFRNDAGPVLALWHPEFEQSLHLPVGDVAAVRVMDIMGKTEDHTPAGGAVSLTVGPNPVYVHGASYRLYGTPPATLPSLEGRDVLSLLPGEERTVQLLGGTVAQLESVRVFGNADVAVTTDDGLAARIAAPPDLGSDPIPVLVTYRGTAETRRDLLFWIVRRQAIRIDSFDVRVSEGTAAVAVTVSNADKRAVQARVVLVVNGTPQPPVDLLLEPSAQTEGLIPLPISGPVDPTKRFELDLSLTCRNANDVRKSKAMNLLAAHREPSAETADLPSRVAIQGKGASGRLDDADITLRWTPEALLLDVTVHDDVHTQRLGDGTVWREDSLQLAFDTHPELDAVYEPLTSTFTKKITEIAVAKTPDGVLAWRHRTHNAGELPTGNITEDLGIEAKRDDDTKTTRYQLRIPWIQIGLDHVSAGKPIGMALLVNDHDGEGSQRTGIELFGGIMRSKNHKEFGIFVLE